MNEELKKAYEILGLPEDATREQVENRYFILLKRERAQSSRSGDAETDETGETSSDLAEITRAYRLILGLETEKLSTEPKQGKVAHFFYYYKVHVIVSLLIVLIAGFMIKENIDKRIAESKLPPIDLSVSVFGNFYFVDTDKLAQNMLRLVPEWKRIDTKLTYVPTEIKSEQDIALQQKSVLNLITEKDELYILDEKNFESLMNQHAFQKLEELPGWSDLQVSEDKVRRGKTEDDTEEHAYGVDITGHPVFEGIELTGERQIVAVRAKFEKWPDTLKLLSKLVQPAA